MRDDSGKEDALPARRRQHPAMSARVHQHRLARPERVRATIGRDQAGERRKADATVAHVSRGDQLCRAAAAGDPHPERQLDGFRVRCRSEARERLPQSLSDEEKGWMGQEGRGAGLGRARLPRPALARPAGPPNRDKNPTTSSSSACAPTRRTPWCRCSTPWRSTTGRSERDSTDEHTPSPRPAVPHPLRRCQLLPPHPRPPATAPGRRRPTHSSGSRWLA